MIRPIWTALVLALLLSAPARAQDAAITPVVGGILVEGNRRVEIDAVKAAVSTKQGQALDEARLDEDIKSVMRLGFFSDVIVEARGDPARPTLVFRVVERPAVRQVRIVGNEEISSDDLKESIADVKPFSILDLKTVTAATKRILGKYVEKGFFLAEVTHRLEEQPDNQVDVVFDVAEHAKVQVRQITFIGNEHIPREEITPYMQTQEGGWLSFLTSAGTYREEAFQRDLGAVQFVYGDRGYLYAKVDQPAISLSPDRKYMSITLRVEEGEQYRVGEVGFEGELLDRQPLLERIAQVEPGELFARSRVGKDITTIGDVYKDMGYAYANVTPLTNVNEEEKTVALSYDVQPGQKVYFERIDIAGNSRTRDKVIRRELRMFEGALYGQTAINTSRQRVTALGYFETVEIKTERGSADDKIVARVEVKEKSTGTFQIGAGFSSYENFILTGQISQNNFFGWGQSLSLQVQWSSIRQLGNIQFIEPYFLDTRWTFAFDLYATEATYTTFDRTAFGGSLTWGYELVGLAPYWNFARNLEDMRLFATYTNERVNVTRNFDDVLLANRFRSGTTSALRLSLQWDKRDNRLFPTAGFFQTVSAEFAPPLLAPESVFGNAVNLFSRYTVDSRFYRPLFWGLVGRMKLSAGYIREWDSAHPVPISELYYLGGINSVRGYRMLSISPRVTAAGEPRGDAATDLISVGGDKQLTLNFEIEFPIMEKVGIRGVVFHDLGNAFRPGRFTDPEVPFSLYRSVGFGVRWFSPIGPLRFEWGFPLNRRRDVRNGDFEDETVDFQFTIGNFF